MQARTRRKYHLALVALIAAAGLSACGDDSDDSETTDQPVAEDSFTEQPTGEVSELDVVEVGEGKEPVTGEDEPVPAADEEAVDTTADDNKAIDTQALLADIRARDAAARRAEIVEKQPPTVTVLRALDKITARVTTLEVTEGQETLFGTLAINARKCSSRPPEETPETFAYLEIDDIKTSNERQRVFEGWMLASSPALNPLEHPVYDVWVIACKISEGEASAASE